MATKTIHSRAPTRIDLAGGTVDLWPLYLFLDHPITINLGINLFAEAEVSFSDVQPPRFTLRSEDQGKELSLDWPELLKDPVSQKVPPALELHWKLLYHFAHEKLKVDHEAFDFSLTLSSHAKSPAGAGLGGSSALAIAMVGALATWARGGLIDVDRDGETFIEIVRDVETTVIQVPAGIQDYYGAMFGGLQSLYWGQGSHRREWLPEKALKEVESRLLLFYSGQSRNSGINNWTLFKGFIDKDPQVRSKFNGIAKATQSLDRALHSQDWQAVGASIAQEWETRRTLAAGISTPEIDAAFAEAKRLDPSCSGKICGAGGGGCFFIYLPSGDTALKEKVTASLSKLSGIQHLPFQAVPRGVHVQLKG